MSVTVKLDPETRERIAALAQARDRSAHWIMRTAIQEYVEREERRAAAWDDAMRAWHHHQTTGLHLTFEEADAWLARLEAGEDVDPPPTHT